MTAAPVLPGLDEPFLYPGSRAFVRDADEVITGLGALCKPLAGATVLLTGAAGFLGASFAHAFVALNRSGSLSQPCRVIAVDHFRRGRPAWLDALACDTSLDILTCDVGQTTKWPACDYIIHAASIASPTFYRQFPIETIDANVSGLRNLLEHARAIGVRSFLNFSTSEIYGDPDSANIPTLETYRGFVSCTGPRACYDESKRFGETLCVNFYRAYGTPVVCVRPFNNYGPGLDLDDRRVIPDFFRDALAGRNIVLLSDGLAKRTFCYVADAIEGYLRALLVGRAGEAYNIGNQAPEISMRELAEMVISTSDASIKVVYAQSSDREYTTDNPQRRCPELSKSKHELGYLPRVDLHEGLWRTCAYYRETLSKPRITPACAGQQGEG